MRIADTLVAPQTADEIGRFKIVWRRCMDRLVIGDFNVIERLNIGGRQIQREVV